MNVCSKLLSIAAVSLPLLAALGGRLAGQQILYEFEEHAHPIAGPGDVNGDGYPDVLLGNFEIPICVKAPAKGQFSVRSGHDGHTLFGETGPKCGFELGREVSAAGDLDLDGRQDVLVIGKIALYAYSGSTGTVLWQIGLDHSGIGVRSVAGIGDVNLDGHADVALGSGLDGSALVLLVSGRNGALLTTIFPDTPTPGFGAAVAAGGDFDHDGRPDVIIGVPDATLADLQGMIRIASGADGSALLTLWGDSSSLAPTKPTGFGESVSGVGDMNNDGYPDIGVGLVNDNTPQPLGKARVYSGQDGSLLFGLPGVATSDPYPWPVAGLGDVDYDGHDDLVIGQHLSNPSPPSRAGMYSGRTGEELLAVEEDPLDDVFGIAVAGLGDIDLDGIPDFAVGGGNTTLVVSGNPVQSSMAPWHEIHGSSIGEALGGSVAGCGDLDGDGYDDFVAGAPGHPGGGLLQGRVIAYSGRTAVELFAVVSALAGDRLGASVSGVGDLDADGRPDILAGAPGSDLGGPESGAVLALSGLDGHVLLAVPGPSSSAAFGTSVAGITDLDGDGVADLAIGAPNDDLAAVDGGSVGVYSGRDGALLWSVPGSFAGGLLGWSVAAPGDVDGDGLDDVLAGAPKQTSGPILNQKSGKVFVLSGPTGAQLHTVGGIDQHSEAGRVVAGAGDIDRDGHADFAVGMPPNGRVRVHSGSDGSILHNIQFELTPPFGLSLAGGGDADGDGVPDLLVGRFPVDAGAGGGQALLVSGQSGDIAVALVELQPGSGFGVSVGFTDANGDGRHDAIVGADLANHFGPSAGSVYVFSFVEPWTPLPGAIACIGGKPTLTADGALLAQMPVTLTLSHAPPAAPGRLIMGLGLLNQPFKGGVLVPSPEVSLPLVTDAVGGFGWNLVWPGGVPPGTSVYVQAWITAATAPQGLAATYGLKGLVF